MVPLLSHCPGYCKTVPPVWVDLAVRIAVGNETSSRVEGPTAVWRVAVVVVVVVRRRIAGLQGKQTGLDILKVGGYSPRVEERGVGWGNGTARNYSELVEAVGSTRIAEPSRKSMAGNEGMRIVRAGAPASFDRCTDRLSPSGRGTYRRERQVRSREIVVLHAGLLMLPAPASWRDDLIACRLERPERHRSKLRQTWVSASSRRREEEEGEQKSERHETGS